MKKSHNKIAFNTLGFVLLFVAINAFAGGYYGMNGAAEIPVKWLEGSPFQSYFLPSLFLFVVIGGLSLFSSLKIFFHKPIGRKAASYTGILLVLWIIVQVSIIGYVSWMQPVTAILGIIILIMVSKLPIQNAY